MKRRNYPSIKNYPGEKERKAAYMDLCPDADRADCFRHIAVAYRTPGGGTARADLHSVLVYGRDAVRLYLSERI